MWRTARGGPSATTGLDQPGQALCAAERRREDGRSAPCCPSQPACSPQRSLLPPAGGQGAHTDPAPALCWATRRALATEPTGHSGQRPEQGPPSEDSKPRGPLGAPTPVASGGRVDPRLGRSFPIPAQTFYRTNPRERPSGEQWVCVPGWHLRLRASGHGPSARPSKESRLQRPPGSVPGERPFVTVPANEQAGAQVPEAPTRPPCAQ